ncbi:phospholipase A1 VesT1.02-like [Phlebotomus papatasi]|uniref:Uncharacterized protein n=1 Tax=Phlebotomus papatasi TaxID=29031 RepID=A0A1B0FY95_PHLPP|nr:phospholipase A1 VesT1.02-like [Phlebotomus papatasi]
MKVFVLLLCISAVLAFPEGLLPRELPDEAMPEQEFVPVIDNEEWAMIPDADGKFHLVNVHEALNQEPENFFNPESDVHFLLFTRSNPISGQTVIRNNAASLANSNFNPNNPTRILIHGWNGSSGSTSNTVVRQAYIRRGSFNVFVVDWSAGAGTINYAAARARVGPTGTVVGNFIHFLVNSGGAQRSQISVIGHSLGAHVAGFAGKNHPSPNQLHSVVGLDPAGPLFTMGNPGGRMDSDDASFVESIHTNAGTLGFDQPIGDATYYPNWGESQPGCGIDVSGACAHARSNHFFAESINSDTHFYAVRCPLGYWQITNRSCPQSGASRRMGGEPLDTSSVTGVFWLPTASSSPFAMGSI